MKNRKIILFATVLIILLSAAVPGYTAPTEIMEEQDLEVGASGYGLTVFEGDSPDTFAVEVLGVLENIMPGQDLILIRAESPIIEQTQVLSGMSGSPIYVEDKLIGALGYAWAFQKEAIAGVTPARDLLAAHRGRNLARGDDGLSQIASPVIAAGFNERVLAPIEEIFKQYDAAVDFVSGGSLSSGEMVAPSEVNLKSGSAVGVQLVRGDLNLSSIGTVTEVEDDRVFAFGHPFMGEGEVEFPMTAASVQTLMPSLQSSFKIATTKEPVGSVVEDRLGGIVGQLGREAEMLPMRVRVENPAEQYHEEYNVEVVQNQYLSPSLINLVAANFALDKLSQMGINLLETSINLELADAPDLEMQRLYSAQMSYDPLAFLPVSRIWMNPFETPKVEGVDVRMTLYPGEREAIIEELWTEPGTPRAGEQLSVYVKINPYRGPKFVEEFKFKIPEDVEGRVEIAAMPADRLVGELPAPYSLEQLVEVMNETRTQDELAVLLRYPGTELQMEGVSLKEVPGSLLAPLMESRAGAPSVRSPSIKNLRELDKFLLGSRTLQLDVKN